MANPKEAMLEPVISIGTLAGRTGLSVSAIRKYETEGLLISYRAPSGHRLFSHEDLERVKIIRHMIQDLGLNMEGIRRLLALLPCWELAGCSQKRRDRCPAYEDKTKPCWMIRGGGCSKTADECRVCPVYRFGSQCTEDMKRLVYGRSAPSGPGQIAGKRLDDTVRRREERP